MDPIDFSLSTYATQVNWITSEMEKVKTGPINEASLVKCRELYARMEQLRREFREWEARQKG